MQAAHICVIQPGLDLAALDYLDHAQYLQRALLSLGVDVSMAKNRLRTDRINLVLGVHLGADPQALLDHPCILINLENLHPATTAVSSHDLSLMRSHAVLDADGSFCEAYHDPSQRAERIRWAAGASDKLIHATPALEKRPIELLYRGPVNERCAAILNKIKALGVVISRPDEAIAGPELAHLMGNARAVLQLLETDQAGFDVKCAAPAWWAGAPVVAERPNRAPADASYSDAVHWFAQDDLATFFGAQFRAEAFLDRSRQMLAYLAQQDVRADFSPLFDLAQQVMANHRSQAASILNARLNARFEAGAYRAGWVNVSGQRKALPDVLFDLRSAQALPPELAARAGQFELIDGGMLEPGSDACQHFLQHAMNLLQADGLAVLKLPVQAWGVANQAQARDAMAKALFDATDGFWRSGWLTHRFDVSHVGWLDTQGLPLTGASWAPGQAHTARVVLRKTETAYAQRAMARLWREDFALDVA